MLAMWRVQPRLLSRTQTVDAGSNRTMRPISRGGNRFPIYDRPPPALSACGAFYPASQQWIRPIAEQERSRDSRGERNLPSKLVQPLWLKCLKSGTSISPRYLRTFYALKENPVKENDSILFMYCWIHAQLIIVIPPDV